jgi:hypothetical protein
LVLRRGGRQLLERRLDAVAVERALEVSEWIELLRPDLPGRVDSRQVRQPIRQIGRELHVCVGEPHVQCPGVLSLEPLLGQETPCGFLEARFERGHAVQLGVECFRAGGLQCADEVADLPPRRASLDPGRCVVAGLVERARQCPQLAPLGVRGHERRPGHRDLRLDALLHLDIGFSGAASWKPATAGHQQRHHQQSRSPHE